MKKPGPSHEGPGLRCRHRRNLLGRVLLLSPAGKIHEGHPGKRPSNNDADCRVERFEHGFVSCSSRLILTYVGVSADCVFHAVLFPPHRMKVLDYADKDAGDKQPPMIPGRSPHDAANELIVQRPYLDIGSRPPTAGPPVGVRLCPQARAGAAPCVIAPPGIAGREGRPARDAPAHAANQRESSQVWLADLSRTEAGLIERIGPLGVLAFPDAVQVVGCRLVRGCQEQRCRQGEGEQRSRAALKASLDSFHVSSLTGLRPRDLQNPGKVPGRVNHFEETKESRIFAPRIRPSPSLVCRTVVFSGQPGRVASKRFTVPTVSASRGFDNGVLGKLLPVYVEPATGRMPISWHFIPR